MEDELDEMASAAGAMEVLATVSGLPVEFLHENLRLGMAMSARKDVVKDTSVHFSEVARFDLIVDDSGVDGCFGLGAGEGEVVCGSFLGDDGAVGGEGVLRCDAHGGDDRVGNVGGVVGK